MSAEHGTAQDAKQPHSASMDSAGNLKSLCALAVQGLEPMFLPKEDLFCYSRKRVDGRLVCEGVSERYTIITLLGLAAWERSGGENPIDAPRAMGRLLDDLSWVKSIGDFGLLLWLCAEAWPSEVARLLDEFELESALEQFPDGREGLTTEVAWYLTGLSKAMLVTRHKLAKLQAAAAQAYDMLLANQGPAGIFGHLGSAKTLARTLRRHIGCFADQVYPIVALTTYAQASGDADGVRRAKSCGDAICRAQGPLGQWWWHYDSSTGAAIGQYPVYSVHQDGMAPMALLTLQEAGVGDYLEPLYKGLEWIYGRNELSLNLCDNQEHVIWRSIQPAQKYTRYLAGALGMLGVERAPKAQQLRVNYECRPYHLGWLLYAFAEHQHRGRATALHATQQATV